MIPTAYPLAWPVGRPRTKTRERARFQQDGRPLEVFAALNRLRPELERLGATRIVISTNMPQRLDGLPLSRAKAPDDPAAAVFFDLGKDPHCLACDRWDRVADNLAAIAAHVEAVRGQLRWGVGDVLQAFAGHKALPPIEAAPPWWQVLGFQQKPSPGALSERYRQLARQHHPDVGGNIDTWHAVAEAVRAGQAELEGTP